MLSYKKIFVIVAALISALASCMEQKILFSFKDDVTANFFKEIPGLSAATYEGKTVTRKAENLEVYVSSFSEKFIEKDNLLEYTELNDSTGIPFVTYKGIQGYEQDLYILKYEFTYSLVSKKTGKPFDVPTKAAIFFSIKHNGTGNVIGITPCYFGIINEEDNLIAFDTPLSLKKEKNQYYLKFQKRNKKMDGLLFMPANFPEDPKSAPDVFNIEKIVRLDPNKVGGYKPLIFDISKVFHDPNALQFHYEKTLHLTQ